MDVGITGSIMGKNDNSKYCILVTLITQITSAFLVGVNLAVLNTASPAIEIFINESYVHRYGAAPTSAMSSQLLTVVHSALVWGSIPGALLVNVTLRNLTRKKATVLFHMLNVSSALLMGPAAKYGQSYEALIVGRFVAGLARGLAFSSTMVIVAETTCRRKLGYYQSPFSVTVFAAGAIGAALGHHKVFGTPRLWIWCALSPAAGSLVYFCCYAWIPETPVSLLRQGKREEALETLKKLRVGGGEELELDLLQNEINEQLKSRSFSFIKMMRQPHLRLQFFVAIIAMNCSQFLGIQVIVMYSDFVFIQAGVEYRYVTFATIGLYLQCIASFVLFTPMHRKYGTKKLVLAGIIACDVGYVIFITSLALHYTLPWTSYLAVAGMFIVAFGIQFGPHLCMFSLPSELSTAASRPAIAVYSGLVFWTSASITAYVAPYSIKSWNAIAFVPFAVMGIFLTLFLAYFMPETNKRCTADIQSSFRKKSEMSTISLRTLVDRSYTKRNEYATKIDGDELK